MRPIRPSASAGSTSSPPGTCLRRRERRDTGAMGASAPTPLLVREEGPLLGETSLAVDGNGHSPPSRHTSKKPPRPEIGASIESGPGASFSSPLAAIESPLWARRWYVNTTAGSDVSEVQFEISLGIQSPSVSCGGKAGLSRQRYWTAS